MAEEIPQSHAKLAITATGGLSGENSAYARRTLSASYKGLIQGAIGGATLYGAFGLAIGTIVGTGLFLVTANPLAFWAIPALTGIGAYKGADTFGSIAAFSSGLAESSEINERRTALNERLRETTSQKEADEIVRLLHEDTLPKKIESPIHWKTVLIGALAGALLLGGLVAVTLALPHVGIHVFADTAIEAILGKMGMVGSLGIGTALGAAIGGLAGATIGIDREYIRGHFDNVNKLLEDPGKSQSVAIERQREANRLHEISKTDTPQDMRIHTELQTPSTSPIIARYNANDETKPRVRVDKASAHAERLLTAEQAMKLPVV